MTGGGATAAVARSQLRRLWRSLVAIGLVGGLLAGVAIATAAGARRTSTAYDRLLVASDFPDASVQLIEPPPGLVDEVVAAPSVERAVPALFAVGRWDGRRDVVLLPVQAGPEPIARPVVVRGRAADPGSIDEVVVSEALSESVGLDVGDVFPFVGLTEDEFGDLLRDRWEGSASGFAVDLRIVGVTRSPTDAALGEFPTMLGTPALHERFVAESPTSRSVWVHFRPGAGPSDLVAEVPELEAGTPAGQAILDFEDARQSVDDGTAVLVAGLAAFAAVTALAAVLVVGQLAARAMEQSRRDRQILRQLGLDARSRLLGLLAPAALTIVVASAAATVTAVVLSRWMPIGVARRVEPDPGIEWNLSILGPGVLVTAVLIAVLFAMAIRHTRPPQPSDRRRSTRVSPWTSALRAVPTGSVASSLAFGREGKTAANRLVFAGVVAGLSGVIGVALFGASLDRMVDDPVRWGGVGDRYVELPAPVRDETVAVLDASDDVAAYGEIFGSSVELAGRVVDGYHVEPGRGDIAPVVLHGRLPDHEREVALGPGLLDDLDVDVGDLVELEGEPARVVGSALSFGLSTQSSPTDEVILGGRGLGTNEFTTAIVRFAEGVDADRAAEALFGDLEYFAPSRPSEVTNLGALRPLPALLAGVLGLVGVAALVHLAFGLGGRGRPDLAVLRALGMTPGSAVGTVVLATGMSVLAAAAISVPLGVIGGRSIWVAAAATTDLSTDLRIPVQLALLPPALLGLVLVSGALSGRRAVRRPAAEVLRSE